MRRRIVALIGLLLAVVCIVGCESMMYRKAPPGQVKKRTGYNPASGKYHGKKW